MQEEFLQLRLLIERALGRDQIHPDVMGRVLLELEVVHGRVCHINLLLKVCRLLGCLTDEDGHLTEHVRIDQNQTDEQQEHEEDFIVSAGSHLVTTKGKHSEVEKADELICRSNLLLIVETVILVPLDVNKVKRGRPELSNLDHIKPGAADDVQDKHEDNDELHNLKLSLLTLIHSQFLNERAESLNTGDLQNFEETERLDWRENDGNVSIRDRRQEINKEEASKVVPGNLLAITDLHTLLVEVSGTEADDDIDEEHDVDDKIDHGVVRVSLER